MPTQCVPSTRCGTIHSGWLKGGHPTLADGEVLSEEEIVAGNQTTLKYQTADPTLYTNYRMSLLVICATVAQTECYKQVILLNERFHKSI